MWDAIKNGGRWLLARFRERSTKIYLIQLLTVLSLVGVFKSDTPEKVETVIEQGQETYEQVADSVQSAIEIGKERVETAKEDIEYVKETGKTLWDSLHLLLLAVLSLFGAGTKDAKAGIEYEHREELLSAKIYELSGDPGEVIKDLKAGSQTAFY